MFFVRFTKYLLVFVIVSVYQFFISMCFRFIDQRTNPLWELGRTALIIALIQFLIYQCLVLCFQRKLPGVLIIFLHYVITLLIVLFLSPYLDHNDTGIGYGHSEFLLNYTISYLLLIIILVLYAFRCMGAPSRRRFPPNIFLLGNSGKLNADKQSRAAVTAKQQPEELHLAKQSSDATSSCESSVSPDSSNQEIEPL